MTSPDIPPQAITASVGNAALAIRQVLLNNGCSIPLDVAREAAKAAAPHLAAAERERCAQRLDAEAERHYDASVTDDVPRSRLDAAARTYEHAARLLRQEGGGT